MTFTDPTQPVPRELRTSEFILRPIVEADVELDYAAVMDSRHHLRLWQQSSWPADDFTLEEDRKDLAGMQARGTAHKAFDYTVLDPAEETCLGCVYIFPHDATFLTKMTVRELADQQWDALDAAVYFWMRPSCMEIGMDGRLLDSLREWFRDEWGFDRVAYPVSTPFTQQLELVASTDLELAFELREPGTDATFRVYAERE